VSNESVPAGEYVPTADHRVVMYGLSWADFESFLALRGEKGPRVTYLEGALELMSPSRDHEVIKSRLAAVVQAYLDQLGVTYEGVGAWLLKHAPQEAGLEPDDSYILGDLEKQRPDLALEVVWTSGGIGKLEVYRRLGIGEVWIWKNDEITFHVLVGDDYQERTTSVCVPTFDKQLAAEMLALPSLSEVLGHCARVSVSHVRISDTHVGAI
jgi:Uma2 family endonuclease